MKRFFTLIELIVVIAIVVLLLGMLIPIISDVSDVSEYNKLTEQYGKVCTKEEFINVMKLRDENGQPVQGNNEVNEAEAKKKDMKAILAGNKNLSGSLYFSDWVGRKVEEKKEKTEIVSDKISKDPFKIIFDSWVKNTGNRNNLTFDEFCVLYKDGLIEEFRYRNWIRSTGNSKKLTEDQYLALLDKGLITLNGR